MNTIRIMKTPGTGPGDEFGKSYVEEYEAEIYAMQTRGGDVLGRQCA
jgi:hypothetical protein